MAKGATHIGMDARQMAQILRFAVAAVEPRENAHPVTGPAVFAPA